MKNLELGSMILALRQELAEAQQQGQNQAIGFKIEDIELDLQVVAQEDTQGKLGAKFYVFNAELGVAGKSVVTHRLKLKLKPVDNNNEPVKVNDKDHK